MLSAWIVAGERALERAGERTFERAGERALERAGERAVERAGKHAVTVQCCGSIGWQHRHPVSSTGINYAEAARSLQAGSYITWCGSNSQPARQTLQLSSGILPGLCVIG